MMRDKIFLMNFSILSFLFFLVGVGGDVVITKSVWCTCQNLSIHFSFPFKKKHWSFDLIVIKSDLLYAFYKVLIKISVIFCRPHNTDTPRYMILPGRLPEPFKVVSKRLEERSFSPRIKEPRDSDNIEFSMTSVLNQRPTEIALDGLSESKLNMRYILPHQMV